MKELALPEFSASSHPSEFSLPPKSAALPAPGWRARWRRLLSGILGFSVAPASPPVLRFHAYPDELASLPGIEDLRRAIEELRPAATGGEVYLMKWQRDPLFDLTLCLPAGVSETVVLDEQTLTSADAREKLRERIGELFAKCLCKASAR